MTKIGDLKMEGGLKSKISNCSKDTVGYGKTTTKMDGLNMSATNTYPFIWEKRKVNSGTLNNKTNPKSNFDILALPSFSFG